MQFQETVMSNLITEATVHNLENGRKVNTVHNLENGRKVNLNSGLNSELPVRPRVTTLFPVTPNSLPPEDGGICHVS